MAHFMFQWTYKDTAIQAMLAKPQDRPRELRKAVEAFGGTVHHFYYTLGAYDGLAIVEFPDTESCVACSLTLSGAGANIHLATTVLFSTLEGSRAMEKARETQTGYQAPVGYGSFG
jgi:uncharacterized protein with GYD domain